MSVINRVLRGLDGQGAGGALPEGVRSVPVSVRRPVRRAWWLLLLIPVAGVVWYLARPPIKVAAPRPLVAEPAPAPVPAAEAPAAVAKALPAEAVKVSPPPPPASAPAKPAPAPGHGMKYASELALRTAPAPVSGQVVKAAREPSPRERAEAAYAKAVRLIEAGKPRDGLAAVDEALGLDPGHVAARQMAVALALEGGDKARAETLLREGMTLHPGERWFVRGLGQLSAQRGDYARAADILQAASSGADADYLGLYAGVAAKAGRPDAAVAAYREALRLNPEQGVWWLGLALALEGAGKGAEAGAAFERAARTRLSPELREFVEGKLAESARR